MLGWQLPWHVMQQRQSFQALPAMGAVVHRQVVAIVLGCWTLCHIMRGVVPQMGQFETQKEVVDQRAMGVVPPPPDVLAVMHDVQRVMSFATASNGPVHMPHGGPALE